MNTSFWLKATLLLFLAVGTASAADKKASNNSSSSIDTYKCQIQSDGKMTCWCAIKSQSCSDMIKDACGEDGAECFGGACSCTVKDTFFKRQKKLKPALNSGGTIVIVPNQRKRSSSTARQNSSSNGRVKQ